ncbi:UNVERIFIED_CONTAM: hypothetical protein K2H54_066893 [Gekko kuhli]
MEAEEEAGNLIIPPARSTPASAPSSEPEAPAEEQPPEPEGGTLEALLTSVTSLQRRCMSTFQAMSAWLSAVQKRQKRMERKIAGLTAELAVLQESVGRLQDS